jgi:hypothetical protein
MQSNLAVALSNVKNLCFEAWTVRRAVLVSDLTPTQRLVALVLLEHVDAGGACWPSLATLSRESGLGKSAICDALAALEGAGWVTRTRRFSPGGDPTSTLYRFAPKPAPESRKALPPVQPPPPVRPAIQVVRQPYNPCPPAGHNQIRGTIQTDPDRAREGGRAPEGVKAKTLPLAPRMPTATTATPRPASTTPCAPIRILAKSPREFLEGAAGLLAVLQAPTFVSRETQKC